MRSMTGYGKGRTVFKGQQISVELNAVNRKQIEIAVSLPKLLSELEPRLRDEVNSRVSRGRVNVSVALHGIPESTKASWINEPAAKRYAEELKRLAKNLKIKGEITLQDVLRGPGIVLEEGVTLDAESIWKPLHGALEKALDQFQKMREKEGSHLAKDLKTRFHLLRLELARIEKQAPEVMKRYRQNLIEKIKKADLEIDAKDERLLKEIVFFSDRSDISEELTRLKSHFAQIDQTVVKSEPVGRTLDFMIQEMNREVNTIGSKANDLTISQSVVVMKTELEKIREQIQNIE